MVKSDIFLDDEQVSLIKKLAIAVDQESDPDIELDPESGSIRLTDGDGESTVTISGGGEAYVPTETRVQIDGNTGTVRLGAEALQYGEGHDASDIKLTPNSASVRLGGGIGDHSEGDLRLTDRDDNVRIHASGGGGAFDRQTSRVLFRGDSGSLKLGSKGLEDENGDDISDVMLHPKWASLSLGGGGGSNSDGDIKLIDRDKNTRIHFDGGGGGPADPETTSLHVDGKTGSLRFRPEATDDEQTAPMFYMYSGPTGTGGPRDWTRDDFPSERPIAVVSPSAPLSRTGLFWTDDSRFLVKGLGSADTQDPDSGPFGFGDGPLPTGDLRQHQPLTVDVGQNRVGIRTGDPQHALDVNGNVNATNVESVSDARCKQNVEPLSGGLETVQELDGVRFDWDDEDVDLDFDDDRHLGFIAQEIEEVLPEAVTRDEDGLRSTIEGAFAPVLVEAIKEQQAIIERQQSTIARYEESLDDLETRLERLERRFDTSHPGDTTDTRPDTA